MIKRLFLGAVLGFACVAAGQTPGGSTQALRLGPGDLVDVEVFDTPELSALKVRIGQDGSIKLPVAGDVNIRGLTAVEASVAIEKNLRDMRIMIDPHVTVLVTEYATQGVRVLGQVKIPGSYLLLGDHTVYDAIAAAGGVGPLAGATVTVIHQSDPDHPKVISVTSAGYSSEQASTQILPGDVVVVSRAEAIYVLGDVGHSGEYFIDNGRPMTVLQALALADGVNRTASGSKALLLRKTATGPMTIPLDINRIEHNTQMNLALQPADILIVPHSEVKQFLEFALPSATGALIGTTAGYAITR